MMPVLRGERSIPLALIDGIGCPQFEAIPELPQPVDGKTFNTRDTSSFHLLEQGMIEFSEVDFSFDAFSFFIGEGFEFEVYSDGLVSPPLSKTLESPLSYPQPPVCCRSFGMLGGIHH